MSCTPDNQFRNGLSNSRKRRDFAAPFLRLLRPQQFRQLGEVIRATARHALVSLRSERTLAT